MLHSISRGPSYLYIQIRTNQKLEDPSEWGPLLRGSRTLNFIVLTFKERFILDEALSLSFPPHRRE